MGTLSHITDSRLANEVLHTAESQYECLRAVAFGALYWGSCGQIAPDGSRTVRVAIGRVLTNDPHAYIQGCMSFKTVKISTSTYNAHEGYPFSDSL